MQPGERQLVEFLAMSIAIVSLHSQEYSRAQNIKGSSISDIFFYFLALPPCYTEDDVQYKVENEGLTNLNAADGDKEQDSMGDCRTYCRHLHSFTLQWSQ